MQEFATFASDQSEPSADQQSACTVLCRKALINAALGFDLRTFTPLKLT